MFKRIDEKLEIEAKNAVWQDLKNKSGGTDFNYELKIDEPYVLEDLIYEGRKVKKLSFTKKSENVKYEILLEENPVNNSTLILYKEIEDKFNARVIRMRSEYPNRGGIAISTYKFIPLKDHKVLRKFEKYLLE